METFRKFINEDKSGFNNSFKIASDDAKKISKNYGQKWETEGALWLMYDVKEHIMTYNKKKGELYTDFSIDQIKDMIG